MTDIARAAGTAVKTLYASVGTKAEILHTLAAADMESSQSAAETIVKMGDAPDLETAIEQVARGTRSDHEQFSSSVDLLYSAMASDDGARKAWDHVHAEYRKALREAAVQLVSHGLVAFDVDAVADRLWFCFGLSAWRTLIVDCKWSYDEAERTLRRQAMAMLTEPVAG